MHKIKLRNPMTCYSSQTYTECQFLSEPICNVSKYDVWQIWWCDITTGVTDCCFQSSRAATAKHHRLSSLNTRPLFSDSFGDWKFMIMLRFSSWFVDSDFLTLLCVCPEKESVLYSLLQGHQSYCIRAPLMI